MLALAASPRNKLLNEAPSCFIGRFVATAILGARCLRSPAHLYHHSFFQCPRSRFAAASVSFPDDLRTRTTVSRSNPRPISSVMSCSLGGGISIRCRSCTGGRAQANQVFNILRFCSMVARTTNQGINNNKRVPGVLIVPAA